jgi:hypothetical protein
VGVAGIAATAFALSSQTANHASGNVTTPTRAASSVTPKRAASSASSATRASSATGAASSAAPKGAASKAAAGKGAAHRATTSHKAVTVKKSSPPAKSKATLDADKTVWFTVQSGDSLSTISGQVYGNASDWPVLYYANQSKIASADDISVGQVLRVPTLPATIPAAPATESASSSSSSSTSSSASTSTSTASQSDSTVDASDYSGFQECVIERESGGNSQVMNSSGHYGLYQFSESTWIAYGGAASEFGDATVAEQNAVFATAMADGGESNWAPYDGC